MYGKKHISIVLCLVTSLFKNLNKLRFAIIPLLCLTGVLSSQTPGGYGTGLRFWIEATAGTFSNAGTNACTNSTALQQWNDQSGNGYNVSQGTSSLRPTYFTNQANGNPVIRYGGTHFVDATSTVNITGNTDYGAFFVIKLTSSTGGGTGDGSGDYILDRTTGTNQLFSTKVIASSGINYFGYQKRNDSNGNLGTTTSTTAVDNSNFQIIFQNRTYASGANTVYRIYVDGVLESTQTIASETAQPPTMRIGRHATNTSGGMNGDLAEMIIYNNVPSTANMQNVESYLAIKYGISLNQSTLRNYFNTSGTVIYPATTTHSTYVTDITGIGRENASGLNQSASQNQSTNDYVRIQNPSSLATGDYLLWGSNNGSILTPNTVDVDGTTIKRRLSRVWRVAHTNNVGTVDVVVDLSAVPSAKVQADLRLLIDRDGDGFFDNDVAPLAGTLAGSSFTVTGVTLQNGDYFTIGTTNAGSTPLPIELSAFNIDCISDKFVASWTTLSERNCRSFSVEKSLNGLDFYEVGKLAAHGNSDTKRTYAITLDSLKGHNNQIVYFLLKQTDFDGTTTRFPIQVINCAISDEFPVVYPNPGTGKFFIDHRENLTEATVLDVFGNVILSVQLEKQQSSFDLSQAPKGFYYLQMLVNNQLLTKKICTY